MFRATLRPVSVTLEMTIRRPEPLPEGSDQKLRSNGFPDRNRVHPDRSVPSTAAISPEDSNPNVRQMPPVSSSGRT